MAANWSMMSVRKPLVRFLNVGGNSEIVDSQTSLPEIAAHFLPVQEFSSETVTRLSGGVPGFLAVVKEYVYCAQEVVGLPITLLTMTVPSALVTLTRILPANPAEALANNEPLYCVFGETL